MLVFLKTETFWRVLPFYYSVCAISNRLKYLPRLILVVGKAVPLADINKVPLKYSL